MLYVYERFLNVWIGGIVSHLENFDKNPKLWEQFFFISKRWMSEINNWENYEYLSGF